MSFRLGTVAKLRNIAPCRGKQKHWTLDAALAHMNSLRQRFGSRIDIRLRPYRCRHCGAFHVGRAAKMTGFSRKGIR